MNSGIIKFLRNYWILILVVAAKIILQYLLVNPVYELHRDEFLYLNEANHLSFGYISVPPFTALVAKVIMLLGGGIFWVRFFPALFGALTIVFAWLIVEAAGGRIISKIVVSLALLISVLLRLNNLFQPNSFDILGWTIIFYLLIRYINTLNDKWLWILSLVTALGLYNKYTVAFLILGLLMGLLLTSQRRVLSRIPFWKAVLLALILFMPNVIWQITHHFPVIDHMRVLKANQLDNNSISGFLKGQVMFLFGSIPLTLSALAALFFYKPFRAYRFIGICFVTVITVMALLKAKDYYTLGLYPVMIALGGVFIEKSLTPGWKTLVVSFVIIFNLIITLSVGKLVMPVMSPSEIMAHRSEFDKLGLLRWEDGKNHMLPQDFSDMIGWREMAGKALTAYNLIPDDEKKSTLVFCDNYGETGALNYYNRGKMKEAYSFNTDYIYWMPHIEFIQNFVYVSENSISEELLRLFRECKLIGAVENEYSREKGTKIYLLTGASPEFTKLFYDKLEERKAKLDIF